MIRRLYEPSAAVSLLLTTRFALLTIKYLVDSSDWHYTPLAIDSTRVSELWVLESPAKRRRVRYKDCLKCRKQKKKKKNNEKKVLPHGAEVEANLVVQVMQFWQRVFGNQLS